MNYGVWMNTDGTITAGFESQLGKNFEIISEEIQRWKMALCDCSL